jgi:hypothetical protein
VARESGLGRLGSALLGVGVWQGAQRLGLPWWVALGAGLAIVVHEENEGEEDEGEEDDDDEDGDEDA